MRRDLGLLAIAGLAAALVAPVALADDESDRRGYLSEIDSKLGSAASELSGVKSDSDDGDIRDADGYIDQVRDLVSRLDRVKGDDSRSREVVDRYPGHVEKFKRASAALRSMKGYQFSNVSVMKVCQDKSSELVQIARDFENRNDPEGLEKLPRTAADFKNLTTRFLEEAEKFRSQMEDWKRTAQYFDVSDGRWSDVRSQVHREAEDMYRYFKSDLDTAKERCRDLMAGPEHPVVREVLSKLASSSAGRKEVMENLVRLVNELSSKLKEVPGASGTYVVDSAREKLDAIDSTLQILERTKGSDPKAKETAEKWPAIAREAREAMAPLRELKEHHHALDELPAKCKEMENKLDAFISANGDDSDGIEKIPTFATELGNPVIVGMGKAKERLDKMKSARDGAQRFSRSDASWSDVSAALRSSSTTIFDWFEDRYEETEAACRDIVKTKDHPKVKSAIDRLRGRSGSDSDTLDRDVDQWVERARATYRLDCQAMQDMWEAYCGTDWEPNDSEPGERPKQIAAGLQDKMQAQMRPVLDDLAALQQRVDKLIAKRETKSRGEAITRKLEKERKRLERLSVSSLWRGANDPVRFYAAEYGKQQHASLFSSKGCVVPTDASKRARFPISGNHTDPDCINAEKCEIWEFKPDTDTGRKQGQEQRDAYAAGIPAYYEALRKAGKNPPDELGGEAVMKVLKERCVRDGAIKLSAEVFPYKMCEKKYECVSD